MVVMAFDHLPNRWLRVFAVFILIAASVFAFFKNWSDQGIKNKPGMAAASAFVNLSATPQDQIVVGSSFIYFTFKYYNSTAIPPLLISDRPLAEIPHFSGTAILSPKDLILNLGNIKKGEIVWLLWTTGFGSSKPQVPASWRQIEERGYEDTPGFKGWIVVDKYKVN